MVISVDTEWVSDGGNVRGSVGMERSPVALQRTVKSYMYNPM